MASRCHGFAPRYIVTDKLGSYSAAKGEVTPRRNHRAYKDLNSRAENNHVPFRKRERGSIPVECKIGVKGFRRCRPPPVFSREKDMCPSEG